jgi:glycosyltransferase involved in cell wall biosynthesis
VLSRIPDDPDWLVSLGGDGPLLDEVRSESERLGLAERIEYLGEVIDAGDFWDRCDIAMLLSDHEGSPNSLLEAARAGRPLLATGVGGTREVVTAESGFLVDLDDSRETADHLAELIADPALRMRLGAAAREEVLIKHDPAEVASAHLAVLREAIGG